MSNSSLNNLSSASPSVPSTGAIFAPLTVDSSNFENALWRAGQTTSNSITTDDIENDNNSFSNGQSDQASSAWATSSGIYSTSSSEVSDSSTEEDQSNDNLISRSRNWHDKSTNSSGWSQNSSTLVDTDDQSQSDDSNTSVSKLNQRSNNKSVTKQDSHGNGTNSSSAVSGSTQSNVTNQTSENSSTVNNDSCNSTTPTATAPGTSQTATVAATSAKTPVVATQNVTATNTATNASPEIVPVNGNQTEEVKSSVNNANDQANGDTSANLTNTSGGPQQVPNPQIGQGIPGPAAASQTATDDQIATNQAGKSESRVNPAIRLPVDGQVVDENATAITAELPGSDGTELPHGENTKPTRAQQTHIDNSQGEQVTDSSLSSALENIVTTAALNQPASILPAPVSLTTTPATSISDKVSSISEKAVATHEAAPNKPASLSGATTADFSNELTANASARLPTGDSQIDASAATQRATGSSIDQSRFVQRVANAFRAADDQGGEIRLRLSPPELGSLKVEVAVKNGVMSARLEAETPTARSLLLDNLPALRERLAGQNIKVERFDVDLRQDGRGQGSANPQSDFTGSRQNSPRSPNFTHTAATSSQTINATDNQTSINTADKGTINVVV